MIKIINRFDHHAFYIMYYLYLIWDQDIRSESKQLINQSKLITVRKWSFLITVSFLDWLMIICLGDRRCNLNTGCYQTSIHLSTSISRYLRPNIVSGQQISLKLDLRKILDLIKVIRENIIYTQSVLCWILFSVILTKMSGLGFTNKNHI